MIKKILFCVIASLIILVLAGNVSAKTFHMIGGEWLSDDEYEPIRLRNFWGGISCTPCEIEEMQVGYVIRGGERVPSYKNITIEIDEMKCEENKVYQCQRVIRVKGVRSKEEAQEKLNNAMSEFEGKIEECEEQKIGSGVKQIYRWILKEDCGMDKWCREFHKITKAKNYLSSSIKFEEFDNSPGNQYCHSSHTVQYFLNKWGNCGDSFRIINREQEKCTNTETGEYPDYHDEFAKKSEIYTVLDEIRVHGKLCKAADIHGSRVQLAACEDMWKCGDGIDNDADYFYEDEKGIRSLDTDDITDWFKINLRFRGDVKYHNAGGTDCEDRHNCEENICKVIRIPSTQEEAEEINMQQEVFEYNCYSIRIDHLAEGGVSAGYPSDWTEKVGMCIPTCDEACRKHVYNTNYNRKTGGGITKYVYDPENGQPEGICYKKPVDVFRDKYSHPVSQGSGSETDSFLKELFDIYSFPLPEDLVKELGYRHLPEGDSYCISQGTGTPYCYCKKLCCPPALREVTEKQRGIFTGLKHPILAGLKAGILGGPGGDVFKEIVDGYEKEMLDRYCDSDAGLGSDYEKFAFVVMDTISALTNDPESELFTDGNYNQMLDEHGDTDVWVYRNGETVSYKLRDVYNDGLRAAGKVLRFALRCSPDKKRCSNGQCQHSSSSHSIYLVRKVPFEASGIAYQFGPKNLNFKRKIKIRFKNVDTSKETYVRSFSDEDVLMFCDAKILSEKTKTIGPAGGSIHTEDVILDIPENALSENVTIKIRKLNLTCDTSKEREINYSLIDYYREPTQPSPIISADTNNDGKVDDKEILIFIDKATREGVSRTKIMEEINKWKYF